MVFLLRVCFEDDFFGNICLRCRGLWFFIVIVKMKCGVFWGLFSILMMVFSMVELVIYGLVCGVVIKFLIFRNLLNLSNGKI